MKRKPTFAPYIGSIGPVARDEDLIPQLATELGNLLRRCRVDRETRKAHVALVTHATAYKGHDRTQLEYIKVSLEDALSHYAPPYTCFEERDGEYGFWPDRDADIPRLADMGHHVPNDFWGEDVLLVNDHGNVECGRFDKRGRFHSYWSEV